MGRAAKKLKLDTPTARAKLDHSKSGYWISIQPGRGLGYRKGPQGGKWVARFIAKDKRHETFIGTADDAAEANDHDILNFAQAQEKARLWFNTVSRPSARGNPSTLTVKDCVDSYLADYKAGKTKGGGGGWRDTERTINAHILPKLGDMKLRDLDKDTIEAWHNDLASSPPRRRSKRGKPPAYAKVVVDGNVKRQRQSTANRVLSTFKAILNHAHDRTGVGTKAAWSSVKAFRKVDAPKVNWLTDEDALKLTKAAAPDIRDMIVAALLTGARYAELASLQVRHFSALERTIYIEKSKSGLARSIHLSDEGITFFTNRISEKGSRDLLFTRTNGAPWKHSDQYRPIIAACEGAEIKPIGFHILRHTFASRLAMKGVPMPVIAAQLGHTGTRMTEKHYAHIGPSYVANTFRNAFGDFGFLKQEQSEDTKQLEAAE